MSPKPSDMEAARAKLEAQIHHKILSYRVTDTQIIAVFANGQKLFFDAKPDEKGHFAEIKK